MSLALTTSVALLGLDGHLVTVEVDIADAKLLTATCQECWG